jgi:hypothetical protein
MAAQMQKQQWQKKNRKKRLKPMTLSLLAAL